MIPKSISEYFFFGTIVRYLQDASEGSPIHGGGYIIDNLDRFFWYLQDLGLQVTGRAAYQLKEYQDTLKKSADGTRLSKDQAERLRTLMTEVRATLAAELQGFQAYVVTPKRIDVTKLLDHVDELLAPTTFWVLPSLASHDIQESAKCIAFERPTAAAFHLLRATEDVLRSFYREKVKRNRCDLMWGPMIADLRKRRCMKEREQQVLLNNLDNIRVSFRNPTQHPDKIYDIQEVQDLWGLCVDVLNRMINEQYGIGA